MKNKHIFSSRLLNFIPIIISISFLAFVPSYLDNFMNPYYFAILILILFSSLIISMIFTIVFKKFPIKMILIESYWICGYMVAILLMIIFAAFVGQKIIFPAICLSLIIALVYYINK